MLGDDAIGDLAIADMTDSDYLGVLATMAAGGQTVIGAILYGSTSTVCVASAEFATESDDWPASTPFAGVLTDYRHRKSIVGLSSFSGLVQSDGSLSWGNETGAYDRLASEAIDGRRILIKVGRLGVDWADWFVLFDGTASANWVIGNKVTVPLGDFTRLLDVPLQTNVYAGTGSGEGGDEIAGQRKPLMFGNPKAITPVLVDASLLIYQVHDLTDIAWSGGDTIGLVRDRGVAVSQESSPLTTYAALVAAVVTPGFFQLAIVPGDGIYFKLGASPNGTIIDADPADDKSTADVLQLMLSAGVDVPGDLDTASFQALETVQPSVVGYYVSGDEITVADAVADLTISAGAFLGARRNGLIYVQRFDLPSGVPVAYFDETHIKDIDREPLPGGMTPPPWRVRLGYGKIYSPQTDFAGSVIDDVRLEFSRPYRIAEASDPATLTLHPLAQDPPVVETFFAEDYKVDGGQAEAQRRLSIFGTERSLFGLTVGLPAVRVDVGDEINVTWSRFGLHAGADLIVVEHEERYSETSGFEVALKGFGRTAAFADAMGDIARRWTLGTGWSQGDGAAQATNVAAGANLTSDYTPPAGKNLRITFTVKNYSAGGVSWNIGSGNSGTIRTANGTYVETAVAGGSPTAFAFVRRTSNFTGQIANVLVEEL